MIQATRGTYDVLPADVGIWQAIEARLRETFHLYGSGEIRTPVFESTDLLVRGVGEQTDIVSKQMYADRGESRSLTLRPEGTAAVMRAYDCRRRLETNPLPVFDCKLASCQPVIAELPTMADRLCAGCRQHFEKFKEYLTARGITFRVNSRLVRGLDYYTRTTFEITSGRLGAQNTVAGGGRYDGLAEQLEGAPAKGFGFGIGLERLIPSISDTAKLVADDAPRYFIAALGEPAFEHATLLARRLRQSGNCVYLDFDARSLKSQMRLADKLMTKSVIIIAKTN